MWVLVVEDEPAMAQMLRQGLEEENHTVTIAGDGSEGLAIASSTAFDSIVLDVMLPGLSGIALARRLRQAGNQVPIIMLTARDTPGDIVEGLDAGADDYLVKPFSFKVLIARLRAISRRAANPSVPLLQVDDLTLDPATREVKRAGERISLTATEFRVLEHLMRRTGRVASRSSIIEAVWGFEEEVEFNTVDAYIKLLRDKIENHERRKLIHTIRGYGYILRDQP
ncbi:MAG TPA: response regulator transcription factor [Bryobacteraceae bacterium]|nr:response regulator transcription factor [Bryobacteraceae bacterium]